MVCCLYLRRLFFNGTKSCFYTSVHQIIPKRNLSVPCNQFFNKVVVLKPIKMSIYQNKEVEECSVHSQTSNIDEVEVDQFRKRKIKAKHPFKHKNIKRENPNSDFQLVDSFKTDSRLLENHGKQKKKHKRKNKNCNATVIKKATDRPNFFFSVRIKNPIIIEKVKTIQENIRKEMKIMENCFVPVSTLHVTLFVMSLTDDVDKQKAIDAMSLSLNEIHTLIQNKDEQLELKFEKIKTFGGQVVYISLFENECLSILTSLVDILKKSFRELSVNIKDDHDKFTPHLTVMKMSKCLGTMRKAGFRRIPAKLYEEYQNECFGSDFVNEIQLCSMNEPKADDGFYKVIAGINLNKESVIVTVNEPIFSVADLSSYEILVTKEEEAVQDLDSSWDEISEKDIEITRQDNVKVIGKDESLNVVS